MRIIEISLKLAASYYEIEDGPYENEDGSEWSDDQLVDYYKERFVETWIDIFNQIDNKGDFTELMDSMEAKVYEMGEK